MLGTDGFMVVVYLILESAPVTIGLGFDFWDCFWFGSGSMGT